MARRLYATGPRRSARREVVLGPFIKAGGRGEVYFVAGREDLFAKIYIKDGERNRERLEAMLEAPPAQVQFRYPPECGRN